MVNNDPAKGVVVYRNPHALPRAFFVDSVVTVERDGEVFRFLNSGAMDVARTAVLQQKLASPVFPPDTNAHVAIKEYASRRIEIQTHVSQPALMVLSEIYYPAGWKAFVDGNETEIYRTNSILRSVVVPAGVHSIVFAFDPPLYRLGYILSNVGWGFALVFILFGLWRTPAVRTRLRRGPVDSSVNAG
jgi:hypothetical protein